MGELRDDRRTLAFKLRDRTRKVLLLFSCSRFPTCKYVANVTRKSIDTVACIQKSARHTVKAASLFTLCFVEQIRMLCNTYSGVP